MSNESFVLTLMGTIGDQDVSTQCLITREEMRQPEKIARWFEMVADQLDEKFSEEEE